MEMVPEILMVTIMRCRWIVLHEQLLRALIALRDVVCVIRFS